MERDETVNDDVRPGGGPPRSAFDAPWVHLLLFLVTGASVFYTFLRDSGGGVEGTLEDRLWGSALFTGCVMSILLAHELGHYLLARHHRVDCSLPWFLPVPLGFGTFGAVIRMRGAIPTRNALVDIGAAGPLAGLAIALPLLVTGLRLSRVEPFPAAPAAFPGAMSLWSLGRELLGLVWPALTAGLPPVHGYQVFGDNLLTLLLQRVLLGPLPAGHDVIAHPVFIAAWFGLLVTMLNLIPVGQLDGGHVTHALFGKRAETLGRLFAWSLLGLAAVWSASWLVWFFLVTRVVKYGHPPVVAPEVPLSPLRVGVSVACLVFLVLLFMPAPLSLL